MKIDVDALILEYTQAMLVLALADQKGEAFNHDVVDIPYAIKNTIRAIFPDVGEINLFWNEKTKRYDVAIHSKLESTHTTSKRAVARVRMLINDLLTGSDVARPPAPVPHDLPPEIAGVSFRLARILLPHKRITCPHCGKIPLEE